MPSKFVPVHHRQFNGVSILVCAILAVLITACGGGGGGNLAPPGFSDLQSELNALAFRFGDGDGSVAKPTSPLDMPTTGTSVLFEGAILMADEIGSTGLMADEIGSTGSVGPAYTGDIALTVDFTTGNMIGNAGGFYESSISDGGDPEGTATLIGGTLQFNGPAFTVGSPDISVDIDAGSELFIDGQNRAISGTLEGGFSTDDNPADLIILTEGAAELSVTGSVGLDARVVAGR